MHNIGEKVVYGMTGVCEITDIRSLNGMKGAQKNRLYYILKPLYQNGTIYAPADSDKVFLRPVMTREEAEKLIALIPSIKAEAYNNSNLQMLADHYKEMLNTHDSETLVELTMSIYAKKQYAEEQNRKFGQVDEAFMKQAEELLFGELAVALGIEKSAVPDYIGGQIGDAQQPSAD